MKQAVKQAIARCTAYGVLVQQLPAKLPTGADLNIPCINLASLIQGMYAAGGYFYEMLNHVHEATPSSIGSPWRGVLYSDEVHPGNQLSSSGRKVWAVYFSFLELSPKLLSNENHWFTLMVVRSELVQKVSAGIGQCLKLLLESMFANDFGNPEHGLTLKGPGKSIRLFFTLAMTLQDGSAQKHTYSNRQDAGSRVCMLCKNIFSLRSKSSEDDVKISAKHLTWDACHQATDDELLESWERMESRYRTETKSKFQQWQQACGWSFSPHALLMSTILRTLNVLRPASQYCFDWMHALCSMGVLNSIILWALEATGKASTFHDYLQLWQWPKAQKSTALHKLFSQEKMKAHRKANHIKCSASEVLAISKPLEYFLHTCCPSPDHTPAKEACLSWLEVLSILVACAVQLPPAGLLLQTVERALSLTVAAGWGDQMSPKFHWCLHFEACLARFRCMPACWTLERKHKSVRKYGTAASNTSNFEQGLLEETVAEQLALLSSDSPFRAGPHLLQPHPVSAKVMAQLRQSNIVSQSDSCNCSKECRLASGAVLQTGDVVLHHAAADNESPVPFCCGRLQWLIEVDGYVAGIASRCEYVSHDTAKQVAKWRIAGAALAIMQVDAFLCSVVYNDGHGGILTTLLPRHLCNNLA